MPQFTPRRLRPLCRETYQQSADNWSRMCSQLDDYAISGNVRGITRILNRLHHRPTERHERINGHYPTCGVGEGTHQGPCDCNLSTDT